jgi:hypothetical protein
VANDASRAIGFVEKSQPRSKLYRLRFLPSDLDRLLGEPLVASALYAKLPDLGLVYGDEVLDAYVSAEALRSIYGKYQPAIGSEFPNATLRVPSLPWVLESGPTAPPAVVAADLLNHGDFRVNRAARQLIEDRVSRSHDS